jgi:myo-inositol catabolism protein IolC
MVDPELKQRCLYAANKVRGENKKDTQGVLITGPGFGAGAAAAAAAACLTAWLPRSTSVIIGVRACSGCACVPLF